MERLNDHRHVHNQCARARGCLHVFDYEISPMMATKACEGSLTLAIGKCLWFSVKIKVGQSSLSSP